MNKINWNKLFPEYTRNADWETNAKSIMHYLAKSNEFLKIMAKRIEEYDETLKLSLDNINTILVGYMNDWEQNLQDFPDDVKSLLENWLSDGTLDHIINDTIFSWKADKTFVDSEIERLEQKDENITTQLGYLDRLHYNEVSIKEFDKNELDDIVDVIENLDNEILVLDGEYTISEPISLKNKFITGGKITYTGDRDVEYAIRVLQNSGIYNSKIHIDTPYFAGAIVMKDYTDHTDQFIVTDLYVLDSLTITNSDVTEWYKGIARTGNIVNGSSVIKVKINTYKVAAWQKVTNIKFSGVCDNGVYIESVLRHEEDNPVYNTTTYQNIQFTSVNCALYVKPTMLSGNIENALGGVGLQLINFSNQYREFIDRPFFDIQNTNIEGHMVIPWDYYGDRIPETGTYKTYNSTVYFSFMLFPDTRNENPDIYYGLTTNSTGERYGNVSAVKTLNRGNTPPVRTTDIGWGIDNIKHISFKLPEEHARYNHDFLGFEFQQNNALNPQNLTYQLGVNTSGEIILRKYDSGQSEWLEPNHVYREGGMKISYVGRRDPGKKAGDIVFDSTINKPAWWTGSQWVLADGTKAFDVTPE